MIVTQSKKAQITMFDKYSLVVPPELKCHLDGLPGRRNVFIMDFDESLMISFEEGMECMDLTRTSCDSGVKCIESEYQGNGRYIHQIRSDPETRPGIGNYAFFHMEIPDETGELHILPGQMTAEDDYQWSDGVEPILIDLMNGIVMKEHGLGLKEPDGRKVVPCGGL